MDAYGSAERAARVRVQENLADGLNKCVGGLVGMRENVTGWEDDLPIQVSKDHSGITPATSTDL